MQLKFFIILKNDFPLPYLFVSEKTWEDLKEDYHPDKEIKIEIRVDPLNSISFPEVCDPCLEDNLKQKKEKTLTYTNGTIFVKIRKNRGQKHESQSQQKKRTTTKK